MDAYLSVISICISVIAMIITLYSVKRQIEYNKLTICPYCNLYHDIVDKKVIIALENAGNGPMLISENGITYNCGCKQERYLVSCIKKEITAWISEYNISGMVIPCGSKYTIFEAIFDSIEDLQNYMSETKGITLNVQYTDAYHNIQPKKVMGLGEQYVNYLKIYNKKKIND